MPNDQQRGHTPRAEPSTAELESRLEESMEEQKSNGSDGYTFREGAAMIAFFSISAVSGVLTAMVLVYGTIEPEITLNTVLLFPLVLLAMLLTVPAWALVYFAILKAVEDALRGVYTVIFR